MKASILIVDDDKDIREILRDVLEEEGYAIVEATNGVEALSSLRGDVLPRVILLDLMMPVMDGQEFRKAQLADPRIAGIPVIVFTADANAKQKADRLAAADAFGKPVRLDDLIGSVARICRS